MAYGLNASSWDALRPKKILFVCPFPTDRKITKILGCVFILIFYFFPFVTSKNSEILPNFQLNTLEVLNGVNRNWTSWFYRVFLTNLDPLFQNALLPKSQDSEKNVVLSSTIKCSLANMTLFLCLCLCLCQTKCGVNLHIC